MMRKYFYVVFFLFAIKLFSIESDLPDGSRYICNLVNGLFEGEGKQIWPNGDVYEGIFEKGVYNGYGILATAEYIYEGFFENGLMNGEGILKLKSGNTFQGLFRNGYLNGFGKIEYQNGDKYEGNIVDNLKSGAGTYIKSNGDVYVGNFKRDIFKGFGTYSESNGNYYVGEFSDNLFHGYGKYVSKDNVFDDDVYEGIFKNGNFPEKYYASEAMLKIIRRMCILCSVLCNVVLGSLLFMQLRKKNRAGT
jgi:hypothetical protein